MAHLRKLKECDAPLMLEWMHDDDVVHFMKADFAHKTLDDCNEFIANTSLDKENLHFAVVDDNDEYMGTVSLKNIIDGTAEFAITMRKNAMGKGYAKEGMNQIINIGFQNMHLHSIYWYVSPDNKRAIRFYDKNGYHRINPEELKICGGGTSKKSQSISGTEWSQKTIEYNIISDSKRGV